MGPDTQELPNAAAPHDGWVLSGRYRVIDRLGAGGMAEVFRAHDEHLDRDVAVKVFRTLVDTAGDVGGPGRQQLELQALARLSHPNLITLFDGSIAGGDGPAFLVTELIDGPSLAARLADGPLTEAATRDVGVQIADALAYVHAQGMVHRDVKPANILLGSDGTVTRARLSDFGIVRMLGRERLTSVEFTLGTACYLAPEQARGADVGPAADVYSLGLVLIEALTGVRSYDGSPVEAALARLSHSPDVPADLPRPWPALLRTMTATDPAERPTGAAVAEILRGGVGSLPPPVPVASADAATAAVRRSEVDGPFVAAAADPMDLPRRRHGGLLIAATLLLAIIGVAGYLLVRPVAQSTPGPGVTTTPVKSDHHPATPAVRVTTSAGGSGPASAAVPPTTYQVSRPSTSHPAPSPSAAPSRTAPATSAPATSRAPSSSPTTSSTSAPVTTTSGSTSTSPTGAGSSSPGATSRSGVSEDALRQ